MEPIPLGRRRLYAGLSTILFVIVLFASLLYASGYRFQQYALVETGAIHVAVPFADAIVTLNGEEAGRSGLLTRSLFLDNLAAGSYVVQAEAPGYYPWAKTVVVVPKIVTETTAFLVPETLTPVRLVVATSSASTTKAVSSTEYGRISGLFTTPVLIASGTPVDTAGGLALSIATGTATLAWRRDADAVPAGFCLRPGSCVLQMRIGKSGESVTDARLFSGGVIYATAEGGVFLAETDIRPPRVIIPVYTKPGVSFVLDRGKLIVKDGAALYEISGL